MAAEEYLTRSQVATIFQVSPHTVTRWGKEGRLPSVRTLGGQRRYPRQEVLRLAAKLLYQDTGALQENDLRR